MAYPERYKEIDDSEKELFAEEFDRFGDYMWLETPTPEDLEALLSQREAHEMRSEVAVPKYGLFKIDGMGVLLESIETLDMEPESQDDDLIDPTLSIARWITVYRPPILIDGISTILDERHLVSASDLGWFAHFDRVMVTRDPDQPLNSGKKTNQQIDLEEFRAHAAPDDYAIRVQQLEEDMRLADSSEMLSTRLTKQRFEEIMGILRRLGPQHIMLKPIEGPEGLSHRTSYLGDWIRS